MSNSTYYTDGATNKLQYSDFSVGGNSPDRQDVTEQFVNFRETSQAPLPVDVDNVKPVSDRTLHSYVANPITAHETQPQYSPPNNIQFSTWGDLQHSNTLEDAQFSSPVNVAYRNPQQVAQSAQQRYEQGGIRNGAFDNTPVKKFAQTPQKPPPLPRGHVMEKFTSGAAASPSDSDNGSGGGGAWDWLTSHWYVIVIVIVLGVAAIAWWRGNIAQRQKFEFDQGLELATLPAPPTSASRPIVANNLETLNAL